MGIAFVATRGARFYFECLGDAVVRAGQGWGFAFNQYLAVIRNAWAHHFDGGGDGLFDGFVGRASPAKLGSARLTSPLLDHHVVSKYREAVSTIQAYHRRRAPVVVTMI